MSPLCPMCDDNGKWFADTSTTSVRPSSIGDACNLRFSTYNDAVMYLVWNAMLGCKFSHERLSQAKRTVEELNKDCSAACCELTTAMRLLERT